MTAYDTRPRNLWRSAGAILLAFVIVVVISLATDQLFHVLDVYPPWGEPMNDPGDNFLALFYRCIYGVLGAYIAARLAPRNPMRHAMILGAIGFVVSVLGAMAAIRMKMGPSWYPITLALTALPTAWLGGLLHRSRQQQRSVAVA